MCFRSILEKDTALQNHREEWGWREPLESICSHPCSNKDTQGHAHVILKGPQGEESTASGHSVPVLCHPQCSWCPEGTACVSACVHGLWSWNWAPLSRAWLWPLGALPSGIYSHFSASSIKKGYPQQSQLLFVNWTVSGCNGTSCGFPWAPCEHELAEDKSLWDQGPGDL